MTKSKKLLLILLIVACAVVLVLSGCVNNAAILSDLEVETESKTVYKLGETLDIAGGILKATYSNGATELVPFEDERVSFSALDKNKSGVQIISVRYNTISTSFKVTVTDVAQKIEIATVPTKVNYIQGERLNLKGLSITVTYDGGVTMIVAVSDDMVTGYDSEKLGTQVLTINYKNNNNTLTATFDVRVKEKAVIGFYFSTKPQKLNYKIGADLVLDDAVLRIAYDNNLPINATVFEGTSGKYYLKNVSGIVLEGEVEITTQYSVDGSTMEVSGFENTIEGTKTILLSYGGVIAYGYQVKIVKEEITSYEYTGEKTLVKGTPTDKIVPLFMQGAVINLVYSDGAKRTFTMPMDVENGNVTVEGYNDASAESNQTLTFDFGDLGMIHIDFAMTEKVATGLLVKTSGEYALVGNALSFYTGDLLSIADWVFELTYNNGTSELFTAKQLNFRTTVPGAEHNMAERSFAFRTKGSYAVTLDYFGIKSVTFNINVLGKTLSGLYIDKVPDTTEYSVNDIISLKGLLLRAEYQDETTGIACRSRSVSVYPEKEISLGVSYDGGTAGTKNVVLTLTENGVSQSTSFDVSFKALVLGIEISNYANCKTDYIKGDSFNPAGLEVTIRYSGAPDETVILKEVNEGGAWTFTPKAFDTVGTVSVNVSYMGKQTSLSVNVHNDIVKFQLKDKESNIYEEGATIGQITVSVAVNFSGYTLIAVREKAGDFDEISLPSEVVAIVANNGGSYVGQTVLDVYFTYLGITKAFCMDRKERQHAYYEMTGNWKNLQTKTAGFDPTGLVITEFFDNDTKQNLTLLVDYTFNVPEITFPVGEDRVTIDVGVTKIKDGQPMTFRRGANEAATAIQVTFYQRIALTLTWENRPTAGEFKIDQNTPSSTVLSLIANAGKSAFDVTLKATYSDNTSAELILKDHLADFELTGYDENKITNHTAHITYRLGLNLKVDLTLRINPKRLLDVEFEGYLIGAQGTTTRNTVVDGTDIDYSHAFLKVTYGFFYDGSNEAGKTLPAESIPVQSTWSNFKRNGSYSDGQVLDVTITYVFFYGQKPDDTRSVTQQITIHSKAVDQVTVMTSPKYNFVEGQDFTFETDTASGKYGALRIGYNNGTHMALQLTPENESAEDVSDPSKFYVVSNGLKEYFKQVGGYEKVELLNSEAKTFRVCIRYMGKEVLYQVVLKDRAYITFRYEMEGSSEKFYGDSASLALTMTSGATNIVEGGSYVFRKEDGRIFTPANGKFENAGTEYTFLPAGSYNIAATYVGAQYLYNAAEKDIGTFNVIKRVLRLYYTSIPSIVYGDQTPNFISYLKGVGFMGEEGFDVIGTPQYTAYLGGNLLQNAPKNATQTNVPYYIGVTGVASDNYQIICPGEPNNPYAMFEITRRAIKIDPTEESAVYGDALPTVGYEAYVDENGTDVLLDEEYLSELSGAPTAFDTGVSLLDNSVSVRQPNAGIYELNAAIMQESNLNFNISIVAKKYVTINKAPLAVGYQAKSTTYGDAVSFDSIAGNLSITGWKRNDEGNISYAVSFAVNGGEYLTGDRFLQAVKNANLYTLKAGEMQFDNYFVDSYTDGTYTVTQKSVVVTAKTAQKEYGMADPTFAYTATGVLPGDTLLGKLSRETGENVIDGNGYALNVGTLSNQNYALTMAETPSYLKITKRELVLTIASADLRKLYDGYAPSVKKYVLVLANGGAVADDKVYIAGTAPNKDQISFAFSSMLPDKTTATSPLSVYLANNDNNHNIKFATEYKYFIDRRPVEVEWLKLPLAGGAGVPFVRGSSYPYIYGQKHMITAVVKSVGLDLNPDRIEDMSVIISSSFDQYRDGRTNNYGFSNIGTYNPSVTGVNNSNFELSGTASTSFAIEANTVFVSIAESARSKSYNRVTATVDTTDISKITLYERKRDEMGAIAIGNETVEITNVDYKTAVIRIINFNVGTKAGGVSDVATDSSDGGYQITMNISDPYLGANFRTSFSDDQSQRYFIKPRAISIKVFGGLSKTYDGDVPFISATNLGSSDANYITTATLQDMLRFIPASLDMKIGDVGGYTLGVEVEKYPNYAFSFESDNYLYEITKKEIFVALTGTTKYYVGEKQIALSETDVKARDNNLGKGDKWEDVFQSLKFAFQYRTNPLSVLNEGNSIGAKGNVGMYDLTLDTTTSVHKNYTFRWFSDAFFTVTAAEVSLLPGQTTIIYGDAEGEVAPYRSNYKARFDRGTDGTADASVFTALVKDSLFLDRDNKVAVGVNYYNIVLSGDWLAESANGIHSAFPNYRVNLATSDGRNKFQITKRQITVKIDDYTKEFGTTLSSASLVVLFPNLQNELKFTDDVLSILSGYQIAANGAGYSFLSGITYSYKYLGAWTSASQSPTESLANSTREPNGESGIFGYKTEFTELPYMANYQFAYAESGEGNVYVQEKALNFTIDAFERVYRDEWKTGAADADITQLNFGDYFRIEGKVNGDTAVLRYPKLAMTDGFSTAYESFLTADAGTQITITRAWFDEQSSNDVNWNRNYVFNFDFTENTSATVVKATLNAIIKTTSGADEVTKSYGTLPSARDLKIMYTGFRGADTYAHGSGDTTVVQTAAAIPNFVSNLMTEGGISTALLYEVGSHSIAPDIQAFSATNYDVVVDTSIVQNPFTFKVTKKNLAVRSAPVGGESNILKKLYGTILTRDTDYVVSFGENTDGFVTSVMLPDDTIVDVADSAESVFYNQNPSAEWVSYNKSVNVVRNVPTAAEIAPNVLYMNEVSANYNVVSAVGESLKLEIYNKIQLVELANSINDKYYAYVAKASPNTVRVKITYIDDEIIYVNLPLTGESFSYDGNLNHVITVNVDSYNAQSISNQVAILTVSEVNDLGETSVSNVDTDLMGVNIVLRNVEGADKAVSSDNLNLNFVGTPLDGRTTASQNVINYTGNEANIAAAAKFNMLDTSFLLMRTKNGGVFDVIIYNARSVANATYRYVIRVKTDSYQKGSGKQSLAVYEQAATAGVFGSIDDENAAATYLMGSLDLFDEESHGYRVFLNKLTNSIQIVVDGVVIVSHRIAKGALADEAQIGFSLDKAFGYITKVALTTEGYDKEDSIRVVAKSDAERILALGVEQFVRIKMEDYFKFLWSYSNDFYHAEFEMPTIKYYIDGAETTPVGGYMSFEKGSYNVTAKAFRGSVELSSASFVLAVADGYYRDEYVHLNGDGEIDERFTPTVNTPTTILGGGEKVYEGLQITTAYTYYTVDIDSVDLAESVDGAYNRSIEFNVKSSDPKTTAFSVGVSDLNYVGLTLKIERMNQTYTTSLKLVAGNGATTVRPAVVSTTTIDWTKKSGVYSVQVAIDKQNLYIRAEILFNGQKVHAFYIDGMIDDGGTEQDAETSSSKGADVNNLAKMLEKAPTSWAISILANMRTGHSLLLGANTNITLRGVELNTHTDSLTSYVRTISRTQNNVTTLTPSFAPRNGDGINDSMSQAGAELTYMIGENGFAEPNSQALKASKNRYETYGVRFKATAETGVTNKLRLILAENAPKTTADEASRYTAKAMRNISLTFIKRDGKSRLYFSFNDAIFNKPGLDEVGEVNNFRYEQEVYSFITGETPAQGQVDFFDGKEHTVIVTFDRKDNNVELSTGHVNTQTLGNYVRVHIDGVDVGKNFVFPAYNNISPWYYLNEKGEKTVQAAQTTAPFYDRYFLDERTYAGIALRGVSITLYDLAVSEKQTHLSFLKKT